MALDYVGQLTSSLSSEEESALDRLIDKLLGSAREMSAGLPVKRGTGRNPQRRDHRARSAHTSGSGKLPHPHPKRKQQVLGPKSDTRTASAASIAKLRP